MTMRPLPGVEPGSVARRLTMWIVPAGVCASNACSTTSSPAPFSCFRMYSRVFSSAGEPAGRGPSSTIARRSSNARAPSNFGTTGACDDAQASSRLRAATMVFILPALLLRDVVAGAGAEVDLPRPRDLLVRIVQHLFPLGDPAGRARNREEHREHVDGEAHRLVDEPGVEVHVRVQLP